MVSIYEGRKKRSLGWGNSPAETSQSISDWRMDLEDGEVWTAASFERRVSKNMVDELSDAKSEDIFQAAMDGSCAKWIGNKFRKGV